MILLLISLINYSDVLSDRLSKKKKEREREKKGYFGRNIGLVGFSFSKYLVLLKNYGSLCKSVVLLTFIL